VRGRGGPGPTVGLVPAAVVALIGWAGQVAWAPPAAAQDLAIVGGEVRPVSAPPIPEGTVVIRDGRIAEVGPRSEVEVPTGIEVLEAGGRVVTPGFVDARSSVALAGRGSFDPGRLIRGPEARTADFLTELQVPGVFGMEPPEAAVHPWVSDGVTAAYVAPHPANLVGGFGAVVKLEGGRLGPVVDSAAALHVSLGDGPPRRFDAPTTRQGMVAVLRQWFDAARAAEAGERFRLGPPADAIEGLRYPGWTRTPDLGAVLEGRRPVRVHAHRPDDVLTALRLARELELRVVLEGAAGAHAVAGRLAEAGVPVVLGPGMVGAGGGGAPETFARSPEAAARLHGAGVAVAFSTNGSGGRAVTVEGIVARGHGLPPEAVLRSLTLEAARILGVDDRIGSLEAGKDGDVVVWSGDPVGTWGRARAVVVGGRVVYRDEGR